MAKTEEQVSWNLSQRISDQIDSLIQQARRANLSGETLKSFHVFKEIRLLINNHFKSEERKRVDDFESEINEVAINIKILGRIQQGDDFEYEDNSSRRKENQIKVIRLRNKLSLLAEDYRKEVLHLLDEYGYMMDRKQDASSMW